MSLALVDAEAGDIGICQACPPLKKLELYLLASCIHRGFLLQEQFTVRICGSGDFNQPLRFNRIFRFVHCSPLLKPRAPLCSPTREP